LEGSAVDVRPADPDFHVFSPICLNDGEYAVEALRYKTEGRGFHSQWASLEFFIDLIRLAALLP
jgi:hypothetical protein